jgi:hypothetical protein
MTNLPDVGAEPVAGDEGYGSFVRDRYRRGEIDRDAWLELVAEHGGRLRVGAGEENGLLPVCEEPVEEGSAEWGDEVPADPEASAHASRQPWAGVMLGLDLRTCRSILKGLPVRAGNLDAFVLRRAVRGGKLPDAEDYIEISGDHLDAIAEAGPLPSPANRKGRR